MAGILCSPFPMMIIIGGLAVVIGDVVVDPTTTSVTVGEEVILRCTTSTINQPVDWMFQPTPEDSQCRIVSKGKPLNGHARNFQVEHVPDTGIYNLVLLRAKTTNSGTYICVEDGGFGPDQKSVKLEIKEVLSTTNPDLIGEVTSSSQSAASTTASVNSVEFITQLWPPILAITIVALIVILASVFVLVIRCHRLHRRNKLDGVDEPSQDDCEKQTTSCVQCVDSDTDDRISKTKGVAHEQKCFLDSNCHAAV